MQLTNKKYLQINKYIVKKFTYKSDPTDQS